MAQNTAREGYIAAAMLAAMALIFVVHPWFLPNSSSEFILGLPMWFWLELGIMVVLYIIFYAFTTRVDAFYELIGVRN